MNNRYDFLLGMSILNLYIQHIFGEIWRWFNFFFILYDFSFLRLVLVSYISINIFDWFCWYLEWELYLDFTWENMERFREWNLHLFLQLTETINSCQKPKIESIMICHFTYFVLSEITKSYFNLSRKFG